MPLTPEQVQIIKATVPVLTEHGTTITTVFYKNMLTAHPELNNVFNTAHQVSGHQPRALAGALFAYASNIDNLGALGPAVELICHKHASLYIKPDDYKIVGKFLLEAMGQVLGDALTPEILDAWATAYWQLADLMIGREAQLYEQAEGWTDFRDFVIAQKREEGAWTEPAEPGAKAHPGYVSNILHEFINEGDTIKVSHPYGDFFLSDAKAANPVVLISAGVGLTPMTSILNTLTSESPERKVSFIHGARNSQARAFKNHITSLEQKLSNLTSTFFTSHPTEEDKQGEDYQYRGRVDLSKLDDSRDLFLDDATTEYYICGPDTFMTDMLNVLKSKGVSEGRVKLELFGTGGVPH
ncbi:flavohemoprotein [Aspergillus novofumigatus IBT 16806]|uniref:nitric oxide dioxygenase n=1 Tax=Aspergillus novofumigatus (strain IBT 16806) TaxID=1392255 RepID=A0A2I1C704_ASPN1|nr:flavohemo protein [Aspergillus novofumigatus IBT 16806]PKX93395.1 flavohemo protein [Aspergillus novofumigatus IBT 16806]